MIADLILVHRYPELFKRLFWAIYNPKNCYVIHVDKRTDPSIRLIIAEFLAPYPNVAMLKSQNALWGGYSLVDVELRGIEMLLSMSTSWEFFINLSGQDFPLKSQKEISTFLKKHRGKDFLKVSDQRMVRPGTLGRIEEYCVELGDHVLRTVIKRRFLQNVTPYIGNQWMMLSRAFCEFLRDSDEVTRFKTFYKHTFIADEGDSFKR